jgi:hypothetical protein
MVEGEEAYLSVELEGVTPGSIAPGDYYRKFVHFHIPGRGWVLMFENLQLSIRVVDGHRLTARRKGQAFSGSGSWGEESHLRTPVS